MIHKTMNKQKLKEVLVENAVEDVYFFGKMRYITGVDPSKPLEKEIREGMKNQLLKILE